MPDPTRFVHVVDDVVRQVEGADDGEGPVLLHCLDGFLDAGNAGSLLVQHLLSTEVAGPGKVVASFAVDELHDYRARRPALTFAQDHYEAYDTPRLVVRAMTDAEGTPFLLMHGPEPDMHWEGFASAVKHVVDRLGVRLTVGIGSVPMAVPHTRPVKLTQHATGAHLLSQANMWSGEIRVPASASSMTELRLGEWGHDAMGYVAHIPHYLANLDYPAASVALLEALTGALHLQLDGEALREHAARKAGEIAAQIADSEEVREVVQGLEQQYDAFARAEESGAGLLATEQPLPTGDELGSQFEAFLAGLDPDRPPRPDRPEQRGDDQDGDL
ncbi:PAC2 family protein [Nocardioidaceae bacterium]|nr:PAC2 family protein [Nocardioidaceae bacterium]